MSSSHFPQSRRGGEKTRGGDVFSFRASSEASSEAPGGFYSLACVSTDNGIPTGVYIPTACVVLVLPRSTDVPEQHGVYVTAVTLSAREPFLKVAEKFVSYVALIFLSIIRKPRQLTS